MRDYTVELTFKTQGTENQLAARLKILQLTVKILDGKFYS